MEKSVMKRKKWLVENQKMKNERRAKEIQTCCGMGLDCVEVKEGVREKRGRK